jgi:hypothetical protein
MSLQVRAAWRRAFAKQAFAFYQEQMRIQMRGKLSAEIFPKRLFFSGQFATFGAANCCEMRV